MAIQQINIGTAANDGTGDPIRTAWDKANQNFDELDTRVTAAQSAADDAQSTADDALSDAQASIKEVNGHGPDSDGGVTLTGADIAGAVLSVNTVEPGTDGDVFLSASDIPGSILEVNGLSPDSTGGVTLSPTDIGAASTGALAAHTTNTGNPHAVTKSQVGLSAVTNNAQLKIASNLSDLANAGTARTNLGLGSSATLDAGTTAGNVVQVQNLSGTAGLPVLDARQTTRHNRIVEEVLADASNAIEPADEGKTLIADRATAISFDLDPISSFSAGARFRFINRGDGDLTITVGDSADDIEGEATLVLTTGQSADLWKGNGAGWSAQVIGAGGAGGGDVLLSRVTVTAVGSIDLTSFVDNGAYDLYKIVFNNVSMGTSGDSLRCRFSTNNGSSFSSAANYRGAYFGLALRSSSPTVTPLGEEGSTSYTVLPNVNSNISGILYLRPNGSSPMLSGCLDFFSGGGGVYFSLQTAGVNTSLSDVNAIQFYPSTGSFAAGGSISVFGIKNS